MVKLAKARLEALGYAVSDADNGLLDICRRRVESTVRNLCNLPEVGDIPDGLSEIIIDRICGEFLFAKRGAGQLELGELDLSAAVKRITEGDVSVEFADGDPDAARPDKLIGRLMCSGERELVRFRRIRWSK